MAEYEKHRNALKELFAEELKEADSRGRAEGVRQGMQQGMRQGMDKGIRLAKEALRLYAQGDSPEQIAEKCELSIEQVKRILQ